MHFMKLQSVSESNNLFAKKNLDYSLHSITDPRLGFCALDKDFLCQSQFLKDWAALKKQRLKVINGRLQNIDKCWTPFTVFENPLKKFHFYETLSFRHVTEFLPDF